MKKKPMKFKDAKGELNEVLEKEYNVEIQNKPLEVQEKLIENEQHEHEDHYHGIHHFDKYGHHDDISKEEFSLKSQFPRSSRGTTFKMAMAALVLALAVAMSAVDGLLEKFFNIGGVQMEVRILDLLVIVIGIPIVGLFGSIGIAIVEPWFHFLIDPDHVPVQVALDSVGYALTVVIFFFIFYMMFKNSPIHKDPSKTKDAFKSIVPGFLIVPIEAILFTLIFILALYLNFKTAGSKSMDGTTPSDIWNNFIHGKDYGTAALIFINLGIQLARFTGMYILFVLVERVMKPVNHRYR